MIIVSMQHNSVCFFEPFFADYGAMRFIYTMLITTWYILSFFELVVPRFAIYLNCESVVQFMECSVKVPSHGDYLFTRQTKNLFRGMETYKLHGELQGKASQLMMSTLST